jgi:hypothetical protein
MNNASGSGRGVWPRWVLNLVGYVSLAVAFALGTLGWFGAAFGIGSNCTDKFSCGSSSCRPCATSHAWVLAGGIGQWVLLVAIVVILVLSLRRPDWRRAATIAAAAAILLSIAWYAKYTAIAEHAY